MQTNELMSYNRSIRVGSVKNLVPALNISTFSHFVKSEIGILLVDYTTILMLSPSLIIPWISIIR